MGATSAWQEAQRGSPQPLRLGAGSCRSWHQPATATLRRRQTSRCMRRAHLAAHGQPSQTGTSCRQASACAVAVTDETRRGRRGVGADGYSNTSTALIYKPVVSAGEAPHHSTRSLLLFPSSRAGLTNLPLLQTFPSRPHFFFF